MWLALPLLPQTSLATFTHRLFHSGILCLPEKATLNKCLRLSLSRAHPDTFDKAIPRSLKFTNGSTPALDTSLTSHSNPRNCIHHKSGNFHG